MQLTKDSLHAVIEPQQEILAAVISFGEATSVADVQDFQYQLQMVLGTSDAQVENVFT
jgi:hypothetical protein